MRLSVETHFLRKRFGDKTAIKMLKDAGFDAFDYSFYYEDDKCAIDLLSDDFEKQARELRAYADSIGAVCNQAHAPFCFNYGDTLDMGNEAYKKIVRSVISAGILGADNIIVHCKHRLPLEVDFLQYNYDYYKSLEKYCKEYDICVSVENLFTARLEPVFANPYQLMSFVEKLDSPYFNICCDVGHAAITGFEPADVISRMNNKMLRALHIQENDYKRDSHTLPFLSKLKWDDICKALKDIDYQGDFTYEIGSFFKGFPDELLPEALRLAEKTGRYLISKIK
jgi:sugar phosphate isomerase/epimerase